MPIAFGQVATSAATKAPVEATTYTEQTANGQRSLVSSSANDAIAGTGVRQVRLTYYSWDGTTMLGPFVEVVSLNGVTPVPTVGTNICFIEKIEAIAVGSGGVAAGTISLYAANNGTGTVIGTIATGAIRTLWAHHYVSSKRQARIFALDATGGNATAAAFELDAQPIGGVEQPITPPGQFLSSSSGAQQLAFAPPIMVPGPARVRAYVTPTVTAQTSIAGFDYVDDVVVFP